MRDPGTPRRNPFFERASDASADDLGMGWRQSPEHDQAEGSDAGGEQYANADVGGFATLVALVEGLSDAQPEAAEHLVAAAHEVVLTVKVLVDATEAVLAQQRAAMAERSAMARAGATVPETPEPPMSADSTGPADAAGPSPVSWLGSEDGS